LLNRKIVENVYLLKIVEKLYKQIPKDKDSS
jgi:hypothetical protein